MLSPTDRELAQALIRDKAVSLEELDACRREIERRHGDGVAPPVLASLLLERRAVPPTVLERLRRRLGHGNRRRSARRSGTRPRRRRRTLGGYELLAPIASGGSGTVFKGRDPATGQLVAIKVLSAVGAQHRGAERFLREAQVACRLRHPNLVRGLRVGREDGLSFFVMEFVEGQSVGELLRRVGRFEPLQAVRVARAVCSALECAREHGIVHRDIKPDNILIANGGVVKLCDLGLARPFGRPTTVTTTGVAVGTPRYISPEQARGDPAIDHRSDIYSLGITLFHMLVGYPPFDGETGMVILSKHIYEEVPSVRSRRPHLCPAIEYVVGRATRKCPDDRYETAGDMERDLAAVQAQLEFADASRGD